MRKRKLHRAEAEPVSGIRQSVFPVSCIRHPVLPVSQKGQAPGCELHPDLMVSAGQKPDLCFGIQLSVPLL